MGQQREEQSSFILAKPPNLQNESAATQPIVVLDYRKFRSGKSDLLSRNYKSTDGIKIADSPPFALSSLRSAQ